VLAPGVLNVPGVVPYTISGTAPAQVSPGGSLSLSGTTVTLTLPAELGHELRRARGERVSGVISHLPIDAAGATPATLDAAGLSPFSSLNVLETDRACRSRRPPSPAARRSR